MIAIIREMDRGVHIVEEVPGDGLLVQQRELVSFDLQISLNRGEIVYPHQRTTIRVGDRHVFSGLSKSLMDMRRGGYRKTCISAHLAYGNNGRSRVRRGALVI
ncbi:MAG: FKBP-type peptidyl-prolyl cis-trans isomerase [Thermoanaerobaculia bacterium]